MCFDREAIDPTNKYCWIDTVFQDVDPKPPAGKSFEFYYAAIHKAIKDGKIKVTKVQVLDDHDGLDSFLDKEFCEQLEDIAGKKDSGKKKDPVKELTKEELQNTDAKTTKEAGITAGGGWASVNIPKKVQPKKKWETIIRKWASRHCNYLEKEQWAKENRRMNTVSKDFFMPHEAESDVRERTKLDVWFFQDTSGSCSGYHERFFTAAISMPPSRFNVKMHCFDTAVYETDLKSKKLYGFGGTTYTCIEEYIQEQVSKGAKYPQAVFVITDGYGDVVAPQKCERWYWFLTENYTKCIPQTCKIHMLADFE
jgi:hypothetical protein